MNTESGRVRFAFRLFLKPHTFYLLPRIYSHYRLPCAFLHFSACIFYFAWIRGSAERCKGLSNVFLISVMTNRLSFSPRGRAWAQWNIPCCSRKSVGFYSLKHYSFNYSFIRGKFVENAAYPPPTHVRVEGKQERGERHHIEIPEHVFMEMK